MWDNTSADDKENLASAIFEVAAEVFEVCAAKGDFCIQTTDDRGAVFGSTNRLIWRPRIGFRPDRSDCTERFLREWDAHYGR
jgi:hypothetical protein